MGQAMAREPGKLKPEHKVLVRFTYHLVPPRGFEDLASLTLSQAALRILDWLYDGIPLPQVLQPNQTQPKLARNDEIRKRYAAGETLVALAAEYCISKQRVQQIVTGSPD